MAGPNYNQSFPAQHRQAWSASSEGSSVDPKYFTLNNITGMIQPIPRSQQQFVSKSVVHIQPQSSRTSRLTTEDKLRFLGDHWKDQYHIMRMVQIGFDFQKALDVSVIVDERWINLLSFCKDFGTIRSNIHQFMEVSMELYRKIVDLITSMRANDEILQKIYLQEQQVISENWSQMYNKIVYSFEGLRSLLGFFMIMQLQLRQTIHELENYIKSYQSEESDLDLMDVSTTDDGAHSVSDGLLQQRSLQIQNKNVHPSGVTTDLDQRQKHLLDQLQKKETHLGALKEENDILRRKVEESDEQKAKFERDLKVFQEEIKSLKKKVEDLTTERNEINVKYLTVHQQYLQSMSGKSTEWEKKYNALMNEKEKQRLEYVEMKNHLEKVIQERQSYYNKYYDAKKNLDTYNKAYLSLENQIKTKDREIQNQKAIIDHQQKELEQLKKSKDELLTRLSKLAGTKLTHGNADITDLSDENRPVKIAEKFSELYDNEWTDALEELISLTSSEKRAIEINLDIVSTAFKFCKDISTQYVEKLLHSLAHLPHVEIEPGVQEPDTETGATITQPIKKDIEDIRRTLAPQLISVAEQRFEMVAAKVIQSHLHGPQVQETELNRSVGYGSASVQGADGYDTKSLVATSCPYSVHRSNQQNSVQPSTRDLTSLLEKLPQTTYFAKKCANLCWLMQLRNPKVHMLYDTTKYNGKEFNGDLFRAYTKTGRQFGYLVWPVLLLYENGPTLGKGVAQPM